MRSIKYILILGFLGLVSCENDIDLLIYSEPIPVVYGIICPKDSIHEISLKRSFICDNNIALYSSSPDSNYYSNAQVFLETRVPTGEIMQRTEMFKYELPPRETDMFVSSPNYIYRCVNKNLLVGTSGAKNLRYALTIHIPDQNKTIFAESIIPPSFNIESPMGSHGYELNMFSNRPKKFAWSISFDFYTEFETKVNFLEERNGIWEETSVSHFMKFNHADKISSGVEIVINGDWFYPMIGGKIEDDPEVTSRKFQSIDFILKKADANFYDYFYYEHYLTDLSTNTFTNIVDGMGIFVAYNKAESLGYTLNMQSLDYLARGKYTNHLNFTRWN